MVPTLNAIIELPGFVLYVFENTYKLGLKSSHSCSKTDSFMI